MSLSVTIPDVLYQMKHTNFFLQSILKLNYGSVQDLRRKEVASLEGILRKQL